MKESSSDQKIRGGYYTPSEIARYLADWAIRSPNAKVLEPSCGNGSIVREIIAALRIRGATAGQLYNQIHGVELDAVEAQKVRDLLREAGIAVNGQVKDVDFFGYARRVLFSSDRFDAVIGNPPFIRYQNFPESQRVEAFQIMKQAGLRPSRLTNAWVPFLVASTMLLNSEGRLAMVIPAELLQVGYAAELRKYLVDSYTSITLVTFRRLVFQGIQQEVVLLLAEKNGSTHTGIRTFEADDIADLWRLYGDSQEYAVKEMDHTRDKWTQYFLDQDQIDLIRRLRGHTSIQRFGAIAEVDVGIVTGQNAFFVLDEDSVSKRGFEPFVIPIATRSAHLRGIRFDDSEFKRICAEGARCFLLNVPSLPLEELPENLTKYISEGVEQSYDKGYKCRIRPNWYAVPSIWTPDAFLLRQIHGFPKLVSNSSTATCTDTIHRVKIKSGTYSADALSMAFLNSFTFASSEVLGRSYGGGVLELEPSEAEALQVPMVNADNLDHMRIQEMVCQGNIEAVLDHTDEVLLVGGLGITRADAKKLRSAWTTLRDRRIQRKH